MPTRIIAHLDMDAFFASLEERNTPAFAGKPIVVGSDPKEGHGRGVVSTANYKAREYGIRSAMPISFAWRASEKAKKEGKPGVIFTTPDFEVYEKSSHNVFEIIKKYSDSVEPASIDEFYFDLSKAKTFKKAEEICKKIKEEIRKKEKVTCSIGLGPNKLISKIAAGMEKPDGFMVVTDKQAEQFLEPLSVREIPGIGPKTERKLNDQKVFTVKDLKRFKQEKLQEMFGKWGGEMYERIRAIDDSPIDTNWVRKSIGEQNTFDQDTFDIVFLGEELKKYCTRVFEHFKREGFVTAKTIGITVRFSDFQTISSAKSFTPPLGLKDLKKFQFEALRLLLPFLDERKNPRLKKIRLLGVKMENLEK